VLINNLEPKLKQNQIMSLFSQMLDKQNSMEDSIDPHIFTQLVQENRLGGFGKEFFSDYFRQTKPTASKRPTLKLRAP